jgi:hypothetical protein
MMWGSVCVLPGGFHQSLVGIRQRRIIQLDYASNKNLTLFESEGRQLFKNLRQSHEQSLAAGDDRFQHSRLKARRDCKSA